MKQSHLLGVCATILMICLPAFSAAGGPLDFEHEPGRLMVKFQPGTSEDSIDAINRPVDGAVALRFRGDPDLRLIRFPEGTDLARALAHYEVQPEVQYAEPDYIRRVVGIPNDPRFGELWGMNNSGQNGGLVDFDIDAPEAWDLFTGSPDIVIASIDTGVDKNHEDLAGNIWVNADEIPNGIDDDSNGYVDDVIGWDFYNNDNNPYDDHSHGTHTMGTAAAKGNNHKGVAGVTWSAQIMILKVCNAYGSCSDSAILSAVDYATQNGARVTSNSYGGGGYSQSMYDAIGRAHAAGVLFSAAAGNNSSNNDVSPFYPASYDQPNIVSVAAVDRYGNRSSLSNYGATTVDLGAPGTDILSTTPNNGYGYLTGTSMACPHVTGALAYLMGYNPNIGHLDYKQIVMDSVDPVPGLAGITVTGGKLNIRNALNLTPPLEIPPENQPPVANPGGPYRGKSRSSTEFDGSSSYEPNAPGGSGVNLDDRITVYTWDFGDGNSASSSSPTITHTYATTGTYTVTLVVKDKFRVSSAPASTTCTVRGKR